MLLLVLVAAIIAAAVAVVAGRRNRGRTAPLRELDRVASAGSGQGMILVTTWQDYGQMVKIYRNEVPGVLWANHGAKLVLPGIGDGPHPQTPIPTARPDPDPDPQPKPHRIRPRVDQHHHQPGRDDARTRHPHTDSNKALCILGNNAAMILRIPAWYEDKPPRAPHRPDRRRRTPPRTRHRRTSKQSQESTRHRMNDTDDIADDGQTERQVIAHLRDETTELKTRLDAAESDTYVSDDQAAPVDSESPRIGFAAADVDEQKLDDWVRSLCDTYSLEATLYNWHDIPAIRHELIGLKRGSDNDTTHRDMYLTQ